MEKLILWCSGWGHLNEVSWHTSCVWSSGQHSPWSNHFPEGLAVDRVPCGQLGSRYYPPDSVQLEGNNFILVSDFVLGYLEMEITEDFLKQKQTKHFTSAVGTLSAGCWVWPMIGARQAWMVVVLSLVMVGVGDIWWNTRKLDPKTCWDLAASGCSGQVSTRGVGYWASKWRVFLFQLDQVSKISSIFRQYMY